MHKEIEEAREWAKIHRAASAKISFGAQAIRHIKRLLALFDRMQQEPVVEISPNDGSGACQSRAHGGERGGQ